MKKAIIVIAMLLILAVTAIYQQQIVNFVLKKFVYNEEIVTYDANAYQRPVDFSYVKRTDQFRAKEKQDVLNIFYTFLNNGWEEFSFFCEESYQDCTNDVKGITNDEYLLSNINNFVHPFNSYDKIYITITSYGKVTIKVDHLYNSYETSVLNQKVDQIYQSIIKDTMSVKEKIKTIHDYIINRTVYDSEKADDMQKNIPNTKYLSNKAYGPLINGYGICGGYSDAMALFLNKMGIPNYKVSSSNHVWNLVKLDEKWYHLDLTWDDPVVTTNENVLMHTFFLISTKELEAQKTTQHIFSKDVYQEAK